MTLLPMTPEQKNGLKRTGRKTPGLILIQLMLIIVASFAYQLHSVQAATSNVSKTPGSLKLTGLGVESS